MSSDAVHIAKEMLAKHGESTLIGLIMEKCDRSITVKAPHIHQKYGRPASEFINAETVAVDLQRCAISDQDVANYSKDKAQEDQRLARLPPPRKRRINLQSVIGGSSVTVTPSRTPRRTSTSSALRPAELAKLKAIDRSLWQDLATPEMKREDRERKEARRQRMQNRARTLYYLNNATRRPRMTGRPNINGSALNCR